MALPTGTRLGPYEIVAPLGAGGMGEVYRARDSRLGRDVAVKVLPPQFASDPQFRERFDREARAVASLNHPHICTLHDVGHQDGTDFLVMEFLEGETLAERLQRGAPSLDQGLQYAVQIGDALAAAHRHGITHRDLKPGNVMLTKGGVKLLDFGLAKLRSDTPAVSGLSMAATATALPVTSQGTILGTLQYMAPEQLEGREADARTDIFAFGALLYEMVTGRKAFEATSQASLISAIMSSNPAPIAAGRPSVAASLDRVVATCLAKEPDERWQSAADLARELRWLAESASIAVVAVEPRGTSRRSAGLAWAVAALSVAVAFALAATFRSPPPDARTARFFINPPDGWTLALPTSLTVGGQGPLSVSPDGRSVAFVAMNASGRALIWIRPIESLAAHVLTGTDDASSPFWSPDSQFLGFFANHKLKKIAVAGGPSVTLCDAADNRGGAWSRDGVIVFAPGASTAQRLPAGLQQVPASGGAPAAASTLAGDETSHVEPVFLPDGRHFLFRALKSGESGTGSIYAASLDSPARTLVVTASSVNVAYMHGQLLFIRDAALMAQPFDARRLALTGEALPIADHVQTLGLPPLGVFSASESGVLAYLTASTGVDSRLTWFDRAGKTSVVGERDSYGDVEISPDGARAAVSILDGPIGTRDLWLFDLARGLRSRFTSNPAEDNTPIWSPDGSTIVFDSSRQGALELYQRAADGHGADSVLLADRRNKYPSSWSSDGRFLMYMVDNGEPSGWDLWVLPLFGERKPFPFLQTAFNEAQGQFSPDGRWVAYISNESGRNEVYVAPFPGPGSTRQVSSAGGLWPRWSRDGREIFFLASDGVLMSAAATVHGSTIEAGAARPLFDARPRRVRWPYAVSPDGQRFLVNTLVDQAAAVNPSYSVASWISTPITVVINATTALKP